MTEIRCPLTGEEILDMYFLENRACILEIASFLDRIDRSKDSLIAKDDYRFKSLMQALVLLTGPQRKKAELVQLNFSDRSVEPAESAKGMKATGAWERFSHEDH